MSESLATTAWAEPEQMDAWRGEIQRRADAWLTQHPAAKRRLELRKPEQCAHALYLLTETDTAQAEVAKITGLIEKEVGQLLFRSPELWEKHKAMLATKLASTTEALIEVTQKKIVMLNSDDEQLAATPIKDLALSVGIISDKAATFNGMAHLKIEHVKASPLNELEALREAARQRLAGKAIPIEAEVIKHGS